MRRRARRDLRARGSKDLWGRGKAKEPSVPSIEKRVEEAFPATELRIKAEDSLEEDLVVHSRGEANLEVKFAEGKNLSNKA